MEYFSSRTCHYPQDKKQLMDFWVKVRASSDIRKYPTIWRLRLLLTSRVREPDKDARIWQDGEGKIIGFAMLWNRDPADAYLVLDGFIHPTNASEELCADMLQWGEERAQEIAGIKNHPIKIFANGFSRFEYSPRCLQKHGFSLVPRDREQYNVYCARPLHAEILPPILPAGFSLHKLQDLNELAAYQAVYNFSKVSQLHLEEAIKSDEYCHWVISDPAGKFVSYCECSICREEWQAAHQCPGWIDYVETNPDEQKKGLGKAVLTAGLLQLREWGATDAMLVTVNTNIPALNLYQRTGFSVVELAEDPIYQKQTS